MPLGAHKAALFGVAGVSTGDVVLLSSQTASDSASLDFTSGIDSTYGEYIFKFYNINPATDNANFTFQVNATDGADYNDSNITSSAFATEHSEADSAELVYNTSRDQAEAAGFQIIAFGIGNGGDESSAGELHLFNPASTTYVKHFYSRMQTYYYADRSACEFYAGYINDTTAIDDIQFKMNSGNISSGTIKMWGVK